MPKIIVVGDLTFEKNIIKTAPPEFRLGGAGNAYLNLKHYFSDQDVALIAARPYQQYVLHHNKLALNAPHYLFIDGPMTKVMESRDYISIDGEETKIKKSSMYMSKQDYYKYWNQSYDVFSNQIYVVEQHFEFLENNIIDRFFSRCISAGVTGSTFFIDYRHWDLIEAILFNNPSDRKKNGFLEANDFIFKCNENAFIGLDAMRHTVIRTSSKGNAHYFRNGCRSEVIDMPSHVARLPIKCTVGCGDAFWAAFIFAYLESNNIELSIQSGLMAGEYSASFPCVKTCHYESILNQGE